MDVNVLQNIDLFPSTNRKVNLYCPPTLYHSLTTNNYTKTLDSFIDNSSNYLRQLSSISFWDSLDNLASPGVADIKVDQRSPTPAAVDSTTNTIARDASKNPSKAARLATSGHKRKRTAPDRKSAKPRRNSSELDCCDYWLRFDSDDDSLDNYGSPTTRRSVL
jgi:hypothetical protein